jgi:hypothetical protein
MLNAAMLPPPLPPPWPLLQPFIWVPLIESGSEEPLLVLGTPAGARGGTARAAGTEATSGALPAAHAMNIVTS